MMTYFIKAKVNLPSGYYFGLSAATGGLAGSWECNDYLNDR